MLCFLPNDENVKHEMHTCLRACTRSYQFLFVFKCWYCHKVLYNNVRIMTHIQSHIDNEKQQNLDLSDLTQCKHCYEQFDTPFEMQSHIEKVRVVVFIAYGRCFKYMYRTLH